MFSSKKPFASEITLTIRNRTSLVFRGQVKAVTSLNDEGKFDILPEHTNFISIIKDYIIIHNLDGTDKELKITRGILKMRGNLISIYLGIVPEAPTVPGQPREISAFKK